MAVTKIPAFLFQASSLPFRSIITFPQPITPARQINPQARYNHHPTRIDIQLNVAQKER